MALRIQTNITAINAHKNLQASDVAMAKSLERLSSGYRINRAADDAAGLSISEGFRSDIASFNVASRNTTEANALLQVAEGGMEQIGNMLTRLKELATQSASANVGASERTKINAEGNALISEIDRIANATKYSSTALLDGTFGASKAAGTYVFSSAAAGVGVYGAMTHIYCAAGTGQTNALFTTAFITALDTNAVMTGTWTFSATTGGVLLVGNGSVTETITVATWSSATGNQTLSFANLGITITTVSNVTNAAFSLAFAGDTTITMRETGLTALNVTGASSAVYTFSTAAAGAVALGNGTITQTITGLTIGASNSVNFDKLGITFTLGAKYTENDLENAEFTVTSSGSGNVFQIGAKNDSNNQVSLSISSVKAASLNSGLVVDQLDNQTEAQSMLTTIDSAISSLTSARGTIGASMNRLNYAAANLATTIQNSQAVDSAIRDVDMAAEMTNFTKQQILMQAGTAMLAQANQAPSLILSLLK
jgi:flagellin